MLAATSNNPNNAPESFHVALRILSDERSLPETLSNYLREVISQAVNIIDDPASIDEHTLPEAIQLAVDLQQSTDLRASLGAVGQHQTISPAVAKGILEAERRFAASA